jgi:hypothetical protein
VRTQGLRQRPGQAEGQPSIPANQAQAATVAELTAGEVFVTLNSLGPLQKGPVHGWKATVAAGAPNPARGDRCLVIRDEQGSWWMLAWDPA